MARLIDTHCHLDLDAFEMDRADIIARARSAGVSQMILIGFDPERWESGARLCREYAGLQLAVGLHPTEAERFDDDLESRLSQAVHAHGAVAIGEIGLDYHWKAETATKQKDVFARQIALAKALDLPFVVHQRDAEPDALDVLRTSSPPHRGVMHCFTVDSSYLRQCLDLGLHIGLGGAITFRKLKQLHEAVQLAPLDRIVLESDAPFMTPSPHRGERNEPAYVRLVAERLAQLKGMIVDEVAEVTSRNAVDLFRLPVPAHATSGPRESGR